jgi:hypothetical protein
VSQFLSRFVHTVAGEEVSRLRVALTGSALVLNDLDLNLAAFIPAGRVSVQRAYAAELRVTVPWGSLSTDPLEVRMA